MHKQFVSIVYFHFQNMWKQVSKKGFAGLYNRQGPQGKIFKGDWNSLCLQSLSFCELRVCLDAPCLANDPSTKNERVPSTAGVWNRPSWISVSPSFWPWRLGIYQEPLYRGIIWQWTRWLGVECVWPSRRWPFDQQSMRGRQQQAAKTSWCRPSWLLPTLRHPRQWVWQCPEQSNPIWGWQPLWQKEQQNNEKGQNSSKA